MPCLPACAFFALTFLSPHFQQGTADDAPAAGPYCPEGGIAQMQSGCCPQYYFVCPCGTTNEVTVEYKDSDNYTAICSHCSAPITVRGRYGASDDPATGTGNHDGYDTTETRGDINNTSNDRDNSNNNTGGSWFGGGGNWFGGGDGGGTGGSDGGGWFGGLITTFLSTNVLITILLCMDC